jgi:hypothetical protein
VDSSEGKLFRGCSPTFPRGVKMKVKAFRASGFRIGKTKLPWSPIRNPPAGKRSLEVMNFRRGFYLALTLVSGFLLVACEQARISQINADPGRYMNKEVAVVGQVTQSIGALGKGIYQVDDGTGRLWVLANVRGVPSKGARVGVKGYVKPTITFLGINYATVMEETERRGG